VNQTAKRLANFEAELRRHTECVRTHYDAVLRIESEEPSLPLPGDFTGEEAAWKAYPDARATLKALAQQGHRLSLLSNATDDLFVQRLVNRLDLRPWLSPTFSSAGLGLRKPKREPFDLILSRWNLPPGSVVVVGDTLNADILGAHNSGMRGILITADEAPRNDEFRETIVPDGTIAALGELPGLIETW